MTTYAVCELTYRTSDFEAALDALEAEGAALDGATISEIYDAHIATAASASVLIFDAGDDLVARLVKRPGARIVRERPVMSAA